MALSGLTALSVLRATKVFTPAALAVRQAFCEPPTFCLVGLVRKFFARRHVLEGGGMEDEIDAGHGLLEAGLLAHVADEIFELRERLLHLPLLLFVAAEDANLSGGTA